MEDLGYKSIGTILTLNGEKKVAKYIKTVNPLGQVVFVDLDTDISPVEGSAIWKQTEKSPIFRSQKLSSYASSYIDVPAAVILCGRHACVISRDDKNFSALPQETNYIMEEKSEISNEGIPISYPVIRASEILADPDEALEATNQATRIIRKNDHDHLSVKCKETVEILSALEEERANFIDNFFQAKDILENPPQSVEELEEKEWLNVYLQQQMKIISDLAPSLHHALKILKTVNTDLKTNFQF